MPTPLVMSRGTEASGRCRFEVDAFYVAVKREIEVEAGLFAVGDHIQACTHLVAEGRDDGIVLDFGDIIGSECVQVS